MTKMPNGGIKIYKRYIPIGGMFSGELYTPDKNGVNEPITRVSVTDYFFRIVERFLTDYEPGHTITDVRLYDDYVAGTVYAWEDENGTCHVLAGFDTVMKPVLVLSHLQLCLEEPEKCTHSSLQGETLHLFTHWLMTKVCIAETLAMPSAGREMLLNAIKSDLIGYL
jgi:hypothetical protein